MAKSSRAQRGTSSRRRFLQTLAMLGAGGQTFLRSGDVQAAVSAAKDAGVGDVSTWPTMPRRTLGRTGFEASRLIFGCGAALSRGRRDDLLESAYAAGVNVFDVGFRGYYNDAEKNLAPFLAKVRDEIFLISKARVDLDAEPEASVTSAEARSAARSWQTRLEASLRELSVDHVDAYYMMATNNPSFVRSDEIHSVFDRARSAGKVSHLGVSTHQNAQAVLRAAAETGLYSLAMIAITPGGWYDWQDKSILEGTPPMARLRPQLDRARAAGMGLIGMKAGRYLAGRKFLGWGNPTAFDAFYDAKLKASSLSTFQKSYAFVLEHGLDCVNADMQSLAHLGENFSAAATSTEYFV